MRGEGIPNKELTRFLFSQTVKSVQSVPKIRILLGQPPPKKTKSRRNRFGGTLFHFYLNVAT